MDYYEPRLPCDATQIGRFRTAIGEAGLERIMAAIIDTAVASNAIKPAEFERVTGWPRARATRYRLTYGLFAWLVRVGNELPTLPG